MSNTIFLPLNGSKKNEFTSSNLDLNDQIIKKMDTNFPLKVSENVKPFIEDNQEILGIVFEHRNYKKMFSASINLMKNKLGIEEKPTLKQQLKDSLKQEASNTKPKKKAGFGLKF